jgi:glycine dehydrogenase
MNAPETRLAAALPEFAHRHIGPTAVEQAEMLAFLGLESLDAMLDRVVPESVRERAPLELPPARTEAETLAALARLAQKNEVFRSFIGMGYHGTHTPPVILRNVLENPAWYTAYTPYQPEISQGRLEALMTFQTMVCDLTGLDVANASLLDEGTAAAEAMALCLRAAGAHADRFFASRHCHPQTLAVLRTRAEAIGIALLIGEDDAARAAEVGGALFQYPHSTGEVVDYRDLFAALKARGVRIAVAADPLALTLLVPPGEIGADVAVGSTQRFGVPMGFGGPHAAYIACRDELKRNLPGRLVGASLDSEGRTAYRLALQTREQHIRREKATSNICTAQVLLAVMAAMYAVYHGPEGLAAIARRVRRQAQVLAAGLRALGRDVATRTCFDTLLVRTGSETRAILERARAARMNLRAAEPDAIGITLDETTTVADVEALWKAFAAPGATPPRFADLEAAVAADLPPTLARTSSFLTHPVFHEHRSETEMLRYLRRLSDRDLALDRTMIPLGSCTMKLNATTEMIPVTWPAFAQLHPYAPEDQAAGYRELITDLERWLAAATGYDAVSVQPNSGAQGEYAGLLAIRAWHRARGEGHRDVVLIPSSAHGTNPASAHLAGYRVVVVACDSDGNVDLADLRAKVDAQASRLAAIMVTYPSTHGVFEAGIREICAIVHERGGQVYLDGANLNALVGVAPPGHLGADVSHINLHKTFCIPHGGGGPGVGPVAVKSHLAPFLPGDPLLGGFGVGPVSAARFGSAGILPISWAYIAMMGAAGLARATQVAILNANYIAKRLEPHYPVLYTGDSGFVAHECIIDLRPIKDACGISNEDVAKRLVDYGFHAPTMSFPVPGTLMIEPTESESKAELDRFCAAMIAIREEIRRVETGAWPREDNPLKHAPHTAETVTADIWSHAYSRADAAYPLATLRAAKYWPPVGRIDNVYGDRHLVCTCPPVASYDREAAPADAV